MGHLSGLLQEALEDMKACVRISLLLVAVLIRAHVPHSPTATSFNLSVVLPPFFLEEVNPGHYPPFLFSCLAILMIGTAN